MTDTYYLQTLLNGVWVNSALARATSDQKDPIERLQAKARRFDRDWGCVQPWRIITLGREPWAYTVHWRNSLAIVLDEAVTGESNHGS